MPWVAAVGSVVGGYISSQGAQQAAETQAGAGGGAIASQERMLAEQRKLLEPFVNAGYAALERYMTGLQPGGEFAEPMRLGPELPTFKPFKMEESEASKFATQKALDAMRSQMQLGGQALSTNAITGAGELAGNIGAQFEQQAFGQWLTGQQQEYAQALGGRQQAMSEFVTKRGLAMQPLENLLGLGQASATGTAGMVGQAGGNIANLLTGIGNVQAAGQAGSASAIGGAIGNIGQSYLLQQLLQQNKSGTTG